MPEPNLDLRSRKLTRRDMEVIIGRGESVMHNGQILTKVDQLPRDDQLAETEDDKAQVVAKLDQEMAKLQARKDKMTMVRKPDVTAAKTESAPTHSAATVAGAGAVKSAQVAAFGVKP